MMQVVDVAIAFEAPKPEALGGAMIGCRQAQAKQGSEAGRTG